MQLLPIPEQIWQDIAMDFITGLPPSHRYLVIMVVVDCLSKFAYFIPLSTAYIARMVVDALIQNVIKIHRMPYSIVFDRDSLFKSKFW